MLITDTFKALGDPVRLQMIQRLSDGSIYTVGGLTEGLGVTRQGARKHLQVLAGVDLVSLHKNGRQIDVRLDPDALAQAKTFITELELRWDHRLQALRHFVESDTSSGI